MSSERYNYFDNAIVPSYTRNGLFGIEWLNKAAQNNVNIIISLCDKLAFLALNLSSLRKTLGSNEAGKKTVSACIGTGLQTVFGMF